MDTKTTVIDPGQLDAQFGYCDQIAAYWQSRNQTPTAYVETYGCQQNEADSEKLRGYLVQCGYQIVQEAEGADVVILNTCAIREHAEQRGFRQLRSPDPYQAPPPGSENFSVRLYGRSDRCFRPNQSQLSPCGRGIFHPSPVAVPGNSLEGSQSEKAAVLHHR